MAMSAGPFLKEARFRGCVQLTGYMLRALSDYCYHVEVLDLKDCRGLSTPSLARFLSKAIRVQDLNLSGLESVKNATMDVIGQSLPALRKLNVSWCRNITGQGIQALVPASDRRGCCRLQILKLNGCSQIDSATMTALALHMPDLRQLSLASCTTIHDTIFTSFCQALTAAERAAPSSPSPLALESYHRRRTSASDVLFASSSTSSSSSSPTTPTPRRHFTDASSIWQDMHRQDDNMMDVDGAFVGPLTRYVAMSPIVCLLTHVNLSNCGRLTNRSLHQLAEHCPYISHLELAGCNEVSDEAFLFVTPRWPCLAHLDVEDNAIITHQTIRALANHSASLKHLCLSNCVLVNDEAILFLLLHGQARNNLQYLELDGTAITDHCLDTIASFLVQRHKQRQEQRQQLHVQFQQQQQQAQITPPPSPTSDLSSLSSSPAFHSPMSASMACTAPYPPMAPPLLPDYPHLTIEVLDCAHVTEVGVRKAQDKAAAHLTIKSFYSWRDEQRQLHTANNTANTTASPTARRWISPTPRARHDARNQGCIIL
ncbi:hypothetical protein BC940DRAFT_121778 [Gongronella butleri]|nr:hypothetical protein BC940DRAFT_121778 [Gongronella butleri]